MALPLENLTGPVIVLAPHTDDGEFGCGGTIARLCAEGHRVIYVAFSAAEKSIPNAFPPGVMRTEVRRAVRVLGIEAPDCIVHGFDVRHFPAVRQEILEVMVRLNEEFRPQIVLAPSLYDTHQDHQTVAAESFRAFKRTTLLGYEVPWNNLEFRSSCFIRLSESHIASKIAALECYESQRNRAYTDPAYIRSLACARGMQIGVPFAESFEVIRLIA